MSRPAYSTVNAEARDWLNNWGRMLYNPKEHGRDPARRRAAAAIIRRLRQNTMSYETAVRTGVWAGALWDTKTTETIDQRMAEAPPSEFTDEQRRARADRLTNGAQRNEVSNG